MRALARQLGLPVLQLQISCKRNALLLRFKDKTALWLGQFGAVLAAPAKPESAAYRMASASAAHAGWISLFEKSDWLVSKPCQAGDWLAAGADILPTLWGHILKKASIEMLPGSQLDPVHALAQIPIGQDLDLSLMPQIGTVPKLLLFSPACLRAARTQHSDNIQRLKDIALQDPHRLVILLAPDSSLHGILQIDRVIALVERASGAQLSHSVDPVHAELLPWRSISSIKENDPQEPSEMVSR